MYLFRRPDYQSDTTQFINGLKQQNPALEAQQLAGRALLWDKNVNHEVAADSAQAAVAQKPYVYQTNS
ncbi:DUF3460 family protein [Comamonas sp. GB3 AK4-5]|uniref:DUF3460 family protein n=1 Tax=Comamonas sp. GB3 AK4-5 TaxID=3231487 RepID=UPI00351F6D37